MAYCSLVDLKNYLPEQTIIQLTDDSDTGDIDLDKTMDAIRRADDFIDSHLQGRYPLPLVSVPAYIRDISTKLAVYFLYKRSLMVTMPEVLTEDYKYCLTCLQKIQMGKINPFGASQEPVFFAGNKTSGDRVFVTVNTPNGNMFTPSTLNPMMGIATQNPNQINLNNYIL